MVRPLDPKVLVYYCAGNYECFGYSAEESWELAQRVIVYTLTDFPECKIYLSGFNPKVEMSEQFLKDREWQNAQMKEFCEKTPRCTFFDPFDCQKLKDPKLFIKDGVHFTQEGYDVYGAYLKEVLKEELERF
jgi:lysophospholipase L1-like esterase